LGTIVVAMKLDEDQLRSDLGPMVGPVSCLALGAAFILCGLFQLLIAQIMGPGNSDELVSGGSLVIPWFGLPITPIVGGGVAIAYRRRLRLAYGALGVAAACLVGWFVLALVVSG
jgi:hypothetical protein